MELPYPGIEIGGNDTDDDETVSKKTTQIIFSESETISVPPDFAKIYITIRAERPTAAAARMEVSASRKELSKVIGTLIGKTTDIQLGFPMERDTSFNIYERYRYPKDGPRVKVGYEVSHGFSLTVKQVKSVGLFVDVISSVKGVTISSVMYNSTKTSTYRGQATAKALRSVIDRVRVLFDGAQSISSSIIYIKDTGTSINVPRMRSLEAFSAVKSHSEAPPTHLTPNEIKVTASIEVGFTVPRDAFDAMYG